MIKHAIIRLATLVVIIFIGVCGWNFFNKLSHNRVVKNTELVSFIPREAQRIAYFSRNSFFDDFYSLDSSFMNVIKPIEESLTYPLSIIQFSDGNIIVGKASIEQEELLKQELKAWAHTPSKPLTKKGTLHKTYIYHLSNNNFIIITFYNGIFFIGKNYVRIKRLIEDYEKENTSNSDEIQYINKCIDTKPIVCFFSDKDRNIILNYQNKENKIYFEGNYFNQIENDSLTIDKIAITLSLDTSRFSIDSISLGTENKVEVWINKLTKTNVEQ